MEILKQHREALPPEDLRKDTSVMVKVWESDPGFRELLAVQAPWCIMRAECATRYLGGTCSESQELRGDDSEALLWRGALVLELSYEHRQVSQQ